jgi:3',5'-cyclic AMP phosphodiesterase CpdA
VASSNAIRIAHVTDAHVAPRGRPTATLKHRSCEVLSDVVAQCRERDVDLVLFGGDNIDNRGNGEADLEAFLDIAGRLDHWACILGNHEAPRSGGLSKERCQWALGGHGVAPGKPNFSVGVGMVRVIGIDTVLTGTSGGYVSPATMRFLAEEIHRAEEPHVIVMGHHPLYRVWEPHHLESWDREYLVANRQDVIALLSSAPRVRAYLCGHHHASRIQRIGGRVKSTGFYHILTASPVAYPHGSRSFRFDAEGIWIEPLLPRIPGLLEEGAAAVATGRKAQRYALLNASRSFLEYLSGRERDNQVFLPYRLPTTEDLPRLARAV